MRKRIALLALLGGVFFMLGAGPATAASCSANHGNTYASGGVTQFTAILTCSGVNQVEFGGWGDAGGGYFGWTDFSLMRQIYAQNSYRYVNTYSSPPYQVAQSNYTYSGCWYSNQSHWLVPNYMFRIHAAGGQWGPWHQKWGDVGAYYAC